MKKIKLSFVILLVLLSVSTTFAQDNMGAQYYSFGDYHNAKKYFDKELSTNPAEANFYLGEIAFATGDIQKAAEYYSKGLSANPESIINQIGEAKIKLKSDLKAGNEILSSIQKKNKKDINVVLAVGRAYLDNGMFKEADKQVSNAKKIDEKNPAVYVLEGDIIIAGKDTKKVGDATAKYEMANYFAPDYGLAYLKTAQVYEKINSKLAIEKLKTAIENQPQYTIAYGYLGKIYTHNGFYPQAIEVYKTYFQSGIYSTEDVERYVRALYFTDNLTEAEKVVGEGLQINGSHFVLNRYQMYVDAKLKNFEKGLTNAQKFFALRDTLGYISQDYMMYGSILKDAKRYDEAFAQYDKAISMEPSNLELYAEASAGAKESKDYGMAAHYLQKAMKKKAELSEVSPYTDDLFDINELGYDYYSAGTTIFKNLQLANSLMKNKKIVNELLAAHKELIVDSLENSVVYFSKSYSLYSLNKADSVFDILIKNAPESYSGYRFKALTQHAINPDSKVGVAKPYYEKVIEIVISKNDMSASNKRLLLEAYSYLGYHYYMNDDKPNTILYWNKVLELDPENKNAKLILEDINKAVK